MTEYDYQRADVPEGLEVVAYGYACGAVRADGGGFSAVALRMAVAIGGVTVLPKAELTPERARSLAAKLIQMAEVVETGVEPGVLADE